MSEPLFRFSPRPNRAHEIQWRAWGAEAFEEAKEHNKPILLSISAVWCHWCHVMDETTYSDPRIIQRINDSLLPVRVDNDLRPDINTRYNMGGWPTTAILTPAGEIITGGTFVPPDQMMQLLDQVEQYWQANREQIGDQLTEPTMPQLLDTPSPDHEVLDHIIDAIRQQFDRAYGGIGVMPKFPQPDVWELLLSHFTATGDGSLAGMAVRTLDAMAGSNLYDQVAGGFFRYSTTREWTIPHFEKMLEDNADLAHLYLRAFQTLGDETYRQIADHLLNWVNSTLMGDDGLWGGSQDADEDYYRLAPEERQKRIPPAVDPTIYTHANALMIQSQLLAASLINPTQYGPIALTALEALYDRMWDDEDGLYHVEMGESRALPGLLVDVAYFGHALLDGYEYTGDPIMLERVHTLMEWADQHLWGGRVYWDQQERSGDDALGRLKHRQQPLKENTTMARLWIRLGTIENDEEEVNRGHAILGALADFARDQGVFAASWALATDMAEAPELTATIVESANHSGTDLRRAMFGVFDRRRGIRSWPVGTPEFAASGLPEIPLPALYICRGTVCAAPVTDPEQIIEALRSLIFPDGEGEQALSGDES
ncbi:MAG: thioredoxin domain-containing protein [Sulfobacillus acidophilus]|uniref:Thioredoxin domain-containing protein n=1 Tax=Sulfobacillus acidophilus TaxID=53633 RepID=A0A2T2WIK0_9FIRM|nr:MAG: thioredoxin domain-containing protein [Sulfobacillus acidophilus]